MTCRKLNLRRSRPNRSAFTLVEILIVVIILGILAAVVIPQFTSASSDARRSSLATELTALQQQIAYYQMQHNNANPQLITTGWTVLTEYTDINGGVSANKDATHIYGPYFQTAPTNPLTNPADSSIIAADPTGSPAWVYSETTGKVYATGTVSTNYFNPIDGSDSSTPPY